MILIQFFFKALEFDLIQPNLKPFIHQSSFNDIREEFTCMCHEVYKAVLIFEHP